MTNDAPPNPPSPAPNGPQPAAEAAFPIVGIGASAGGLEAFTQLLQGLPAEPGLAFVLVQHLDPARESLLPELLARVTPMRVQPVQDGMAVRPNQVYVSPPQADVVITERVLRLIRRPPRGLHMPIDVFFRSLAEDQGPQAIGIILSGAGSDGALGLQAIKEHGGLTLAQDERTAAFAGMPHSAVMHGPVDVVRDLGGLAQALMQVARHPYVAASMSVSPEEPLAPVHDREPWNRILTLLHGATGINFTAYKASTVQRRIARRMALKGLEQPAAYANYLQSHRDELEALYHDLLIKVTTFFRNPDSYEALTREVLPRLMTGRPAQQPLRIWVPGCATGEEAYSLAICALEFLSDGGYPHALRLFATDIDELALAAARTGVYLENIALDVSPERLQRFFVQVDAHYQITPAIRERCVFARHNLYHDPPFSNLDLISCRNVLIYFEAATQRRVVPLFHYALQPDGVLTLGPSETIGPFADLFTLTDPEHKFYTKNTTAVPVTMDFGPRASGVRARGVNPETTPILPVPWPTIDPSREVDSLLLQQYAPAAVLVNEQTDILHFRGDTDRYLRPAPGRATLNLFRMAREGLLSDLRAALDEASESGTEVRRMGARVYHEATWREVTIRVLPLVRPPAAVPHYLVVFEAPSPLAGEPSPPAPAAPTALADEDRISRLHQELEATRLYLQSVMEQHETASEELKAANEEVISSNEELQSTNEELETAKEELQSMNEELTTTNDELRHRNEQLSQVNSDLMNLFGSIHLPVIMVDKDLRLRRSTATAEAVLQLIPTDVGRPIGHLRLNIAMPDLEDTMRHVIDTGSPQAREVQDREGRWWNLRILPSMTLERTIDGAVLLLIDIDSLKNVDRLTRLLGEVQAAKEYAEAIVQTVPEPLVILDAALWVRTVNQAFARHFQLAPAEAEARVLYQVGNGQWDIPRLRELLEQVIPEHGEAHDVEVAHTFAGIGRRFLRLNARRLVQPSTSEVLIVLAIADVTAQQRAHEQVTAALQEKELLLRELHHRVKNNLQLVSSLLNLQAGEIEDPAVQRLFEESQRRVQSMALMHEQLSTSSTLGQMDMPQYIRRLATQLVEAYANPGQIHLDLQLEAVAVPMDAAIPCGLILTELITNALQHAFPGGEPGEVSVIWRADGEGHVLLMVRDTGVGLPSEVDFAQTHSLGASVVWELAGQLGGSLRVERDGGTTVAVRFPARPAR